MSVFADEPTTQKCWLVPTWVIADRPLYVDGFGLLTTLQAEPFHCSMRELSALSLLEMPTAQARELDGATTEYRLPPPVGLGLGTTPQKEQPAAGTVWSDAEGSLFPFGNWY